MSDDGSSDSLDFSDDEGELGSVAAGDAEPSAQRVSWAECFFDLVVALAVTEVSTQLQHTGDWGGLGRSLLLLFPFWWGWVGTALLFNGLRLNPIRKHLLLFSVALGALLMSAAVPEAYTSRGALFGGAYLGIRVLLGVQMRARDAFGFRLDPFTVSLYIAGPVYLIGGLVPMPYRAWLWALAAALEICSTLVRPRRFAHMRWEPAHLPERFGLFIIIVLGDAVATIGAQAAQRTMTPGGVCAFVLAFVLAVSLWWAYFPFALPAIEFALRTSQVQTKVVRDVFSYGHLVMAAGVLLTAAGSALWVAAPNSVPQGVEGYYGGLGVALYVFAFCYNRHRMFGGVGTLRAIVVLLALLAALAARHLTGIESLALIDATLIALHAIEGWRVAHNLPVPLLPWPPHPPATG